MTEEYRLAGDLELWARFMRFEAPVTVKMGLAGFRRRLSGQKSLDQYSQYLVDVKEIIQREYNSAPFHVKYEVFFIKIFRKILKYFNLPGINTFSKKALDHFLKLPRMIELHRTSGKLVFRTK